MPSLFRFLALVGIVCGTVYGALFAMATYLEPPQKEMSTPVPGLKVRR
jgi:uncharacterized membrane protein (UPF0136 family)